MVTFSNGSLGRYFSKSIERVFRQKNIRGATVKSSLRGSRHLALGVSLRDSNQHGRATSAAKAIAMTSGVENVMVSIRGPLVVYAFELPPSYWVKLERRHLPKSDAVGLAIQNLPVMYDFRQPHTLIAGTTGSGKTEAMRSIYMAAVSTWPKEELRTIVLDVEGKFEIFQQRVSSGPPGGPVSERDQRVFDLGFGALALP